MKICYTCKVEKPLTEFYAHKHMKDKVLGKCKECCKGYSKARYDTPEGKAKAKEYYRNRKRPVIDVALN